MKSVFEIIKNFKKSNKKPKYVPFQILISWFKAVGKHLSRHSFPYDYKYNKLYVIVDSETWLHNFLNLKKSIIENLKLLVPFYRIKDINFKVDTSIKISDFIEERLISDSKIPNHYKNKISSLISKIEDPKLRDALYDYLKNLTHLYLKKEK